MKTACFIPIKSNSERARGKNFSLLGGRKLYEYIIENVNKAQAFDKIFVDTDSIEIGEYAKKMGCEVIERKEELAKDTANGNHLLNYHFEIHPEFDLYFQAFATAPYLQPETIKECVEKLKTDMEYDSCFTAITHQGFFWYKGRPANYEPEVLPRSQDMEPVVEETTGIYGIRKEALEKYQCRIGKKPYIHIVDKFEAVDINTEEDLKIAEYIGKVHFD